MDWLNTFKYIGYGLLILGAICTVVVDILKGKDDDRKDAQQKRQMTELVTNSQESKKLLAPFSDLAQKLYPNLDQKEALGALMKRMDSADEEIRRGKEKLGSLSSQVTIEKKTIKTFEVVVTIEFSGKWQSQPYPTWLQPPAPQPYLRWKDSSKKLADLNFSASRINCEAVDANTGRFQNTLSILPGQFPLGQLTDVLQEYDQLEFWFLLTDPKKLLSPILTINKVDLVFYLNGTKRGEFHSVGPISQDNSEAIGKIPPGKDMYITPTLTLSGKPVDLLKFQL
ncbi:MAG TPA: hypothetical protein VHE34_24930 [Puia sp.]|uniref:hypothetical protein n=1 Tax=Puia sp. TaxID=2045100 RepID=UPI002C8E9456|nr:hypothetical protein [Puia sp.]HVU98499.1 hypothetical protein [Puia sp.]